MLKSKITKAEVQAEFQDGRRAILLIQVNAVKWGINAHFK
jgi:hypothetical protein